MNYSLNLKLTTPDLAHTFSVIGYIDNGTTDYQVGYGYLDDNNRVWICKSPDDHISAYPWFVPNSDGNIEFSERNEQDDIIFTRRNCVNLDIEYIKNNINKCVSEYRKTPLPIDDNVMYEVKQEDSCLSALIKLFLNDTKVDLVALGTLINDPVTISNLKSSLKRTDLSLKNFVRWVTVLGLKYTIILEDDGSGLSNLNGDKFIYESSTDQVSRVDNNDAKSL